MQATKIFRVNEIFQSIQGEGPSVGTPVVFVRFSGCNLDCPFCDTDHDSFQELTADEIVNRAFEFSVEGKFCPAITCVFTGGEPLLQFDKELVEKMLAVGFGLAVETNGAKDTELKSPGLEFLSYFIDVVVSPKTKEMSGRVLDLATCLKVLVPLPGGLKASDISEMVDRMRPRSHLDLMRKSFVLQPTMPREGFQSDEWKSNCEEAVSLVSDWEEEFGVRWRLIPQVHKIIGIP